MCFLRSASPRRCTGGRRWSVSGLIARSTRAPGFALHDLTRHLGSRFVPGDRLACGGVAHLSCWRAGELDPFAGSDASQRDFLWPRRAPSPFLFRPGRVRLWSLGQDSNLGPAVYETAVLVLRHPAIVFIGQNRSFARSIRAWSALPLSGPSSSRVALSATVALSEVFHRAPASSGCAPRRR